MVELPLRSIANRILLRHASKEWKISKGPGIWRISAQKPWNPAVSTSLRHIRGKTLMTSYWQFQFCNQDTDPMTPDYFAVYYGAIEPPPSSSSTFQSRPYCWS